MSSVTPEVVPTAYHDAIRALYDRINYERAGFPPYSDAHYRLDRMRKLLASLQDPHLAVPIVHVAGTKGKGSTATLLASMLSGSGFRTGLYTSPHLVKLEERFRINNEPCSADQLVKLTEQTLAAAERVEAAGGGRATFFELTTAAAFLHFAEQKAQAVVLEVGLGGRLDSTNVCRPTACVITTIGLDHQAQLGSTIAAIAGEKAGIIKPRIPVLSSARHPDARQVIAQRADQEQAPLRLIDRDFACRWQPVPIELPPTHSPIPFATHSPTATARVDFIPHYPDSSVGPSQWALSMLGAHQADNLAVALATLDLLTEQGWAIDRDTLPSSVLRTSVTARLQVIGHRPWQLIDTAHNPDSIAATMAALDTHFPNNRRTILLATSRDKDVAGMLKIVLGACSRLILTQYHNNPRGLPVHELMTLAEQTQSQLGNRSQHCLLECHQSPRSAWNAACENAGSNDLVCATGSFFLAADLLSSIP